ncbi:RagB/SusD family nutrient uptake outer membrane protein [Pseudoflavitalea sp. G-6-1-2]|uniref:RagB/SusD family nutrient uptake outer membrane protein n=1 Tax=Pseudoflavitalea sp. G-6-1-2 TaxID=2728841 RepID=UPI00146F5F82|nr:RagB/SusD family nutrient uptake outer membrane protein [Pseudoflavitalea sp. G-6-1-2]NML22247.1 RagB/SusD family nutrient uptake outer membrane protein [Pseudoflavitalea sp. G-6-1-2]
MKLSNLSYLFLLLLVATGCSKFTDIKPKGFLLPKTVDDYQGFMNDIVLANAGYLNNEFMTDDLRFTDDFAASQSITRQGRSYFWDKEILRATEDDAEWNTPYNMIYYCNLVLENIDAATNGTQEQKDLAKAEALVHRAFQHFHLASNYGRDYQAATASTDLAVPLMLKPDLEAKSSRATVQEVYDKVITDLKAALNITALPDFGRNYVHPGKAGVLAILARVYFFMGDYKTAAEYADAALAKNNTLLDYNTFKFTSATNPFSGVTGRPAAELNPENLFSRTNSQGNIFRVFLIGDSLHRVLGEKDLRFYFNFAYRTRGGAASPFPNYLEALPNFSIGVPEMMLIKAEYLARQGQTNDAINILNTLRQKRFKPADYVALTASNAEEALVRVLEERRRELFYHGIRWFDLKRLNRDDRFKLTIARTHPAKSATLEPNSPRYVLPIPPKVVDLNPNIKPNER